jgi:hypothetical protein
MNTMLWEALAGILIFAAANIAYFEVLRLIQFLRDRSKSMRGNLRAPLE